MRSVRDIGEWTGGEGEDGDEPARTAEEMIAVSFAAAMAVGEVGC